MEIFDFFTVKLAAAAECTEFVAFEFAVIWAGGCRCVDCLNIHDYMTSHYIRGTTGHGRVQLIRRINY